MKKNKTQIESVNHSFLLEESALSIITICAFSESLEALKKMFERAVPHGKMAFFILTHHRSGDIALSPQTLQPYTELTVVAVQDQQRVQADHIYVVPPDIKVILHHNQLLMVENTTHVSTSSSSDCFLYSVAQEYGKNAVCVILSGISHDGTAGLRVFKERGGLIIAETERAAHHDSLSKSAMYAGLVDYALLPENLNGFLLQYMAHLNDESVPIANSIPAELQKLFLLLKNQTGHDFSLYKPNTIFRRIQKRLDMLQIQTLTDYVYYLHHHPGEIAILFKELLINVTNFFRDPDAFELLKNELLNTVLIDKLTDTPIRVWVPGCSTGEEAYSIAILFLECMHTLNRRFHVQIFGTDIDMDAIEIARAGFFPLSIEKDVSPERLQAFFMKEGHSYKIQKDVRRMIIFAVQNVIKDPPFTRLDLLSCRNLLIYLKPQLQKKVLPLFHYSLRADGLLFLGPSESIGDSVDVFTTIDKRWKIYEKKTGVSIFNPKIDMSSNHHVQASLAMHSTEKIMNDMEPNLSNLSHLVKTILNKEYTPAFIIIDENGDIIYVYGSTSTFLELTPGEVRLHFVSMIRAELKSKIYTALREASAQHKEINLINLPFSKQDNIHYVNVKIKPFTEAEPPKRKLILIIIEESTSSEPSRSMDLSLAKTCDTENKISQLEHELGYTKGNLQTTVEELETSNEELKSSNEELQSTNEELHSLNEELTTVNSELENRIEQLSSANDDIKNLLDNTEIATVFLDKDLCIKRFTPKATDIINLIPTDIGRPVSHIVSNLKYEQLIEDSRTVLKTLEPHTAEAIDKNGHWYEIKIIPYRTVNNLIDGVIITFINIHARKQAEDKLKTLESDLSMIEAFNHTLLKITSHATILIDTHAKVILANDPFLKQFKIKNEDMMGRSIYKLNMAWDVPALKKIIEHIVTGESLAHVSKLAIAKGKIINVTAHKISTSTVLLILN